MRRFFLTVGLSLLLAVTVLVAPASSSVTERVVPVQTDETSVALERVRTVPLDEPAQHVAVYWRGNPRAQVSVAFSRDDEGFGSFVDAGRDGADGSHTGPVTYGAVLNADGATAVRVRSDRPIARLTVLAMREGTARVTSTRTVGARADASTSQPSVRSRGDWGADERLRSGRPSFARIRKLVVHHTATPNDYASRAEAESYLRSMYHYHAVTRGWSDIGYNFVIDKFGTIYEGRWSRDYAGANPSGDDAQGNGVVGAHTGGWNSGSVGIALLGTYTSKNISRAARTSLEQLLAWESARNGIDPKATEPFTNPVSGARTTTPNIAGHRDYGSTECPGGGFYATLPGLRRAVADLVDPDAGAARPTAPTDLSATPRRRRVALRWAASTGETSLRYRVLRSRSWSPGARFRRVATVSNPAYVDRGLHRKRRYSYKVRAVDTTGRQSGFSNRVRVRTR